MPGRQTQISPVSIQVYPVYTDSDGNQTEGSQLIGVSDNINPTFSNIDHDGKYRILLSNLQTPTDVFDLEIMGGSIDIDYIVDPTSTEDLSPNGVGDEININTVSPSEAHWQAVADPVGSPDDDTSYVQVSSTACGFERDLYAIADHSVGSGTINSVTVYARMKETPYTGAHGEISIKTEGTPYNTSAYTLTGSWANYSNTWATNPETGFAWTWAEVNALQAGVNLYGFAGGPCNSILQGQKILMADRTQKNIEDVKVGDEILSFNQDSKKLEKDKVAGVDKNPTYHNDYFIFNNTLKTSSDHEIFVNNGFKQAQDIKIGDLLLDSNGKEVKVKKIDHIYKKVKTYDLTTEKNHNFFASGYLVHNIPSYTTWATQVYVEVSYTPAAPPTVSSAATNASGTTVSITFNKAMASPAGDQSQFTVHVGAGTDTVTAAALHAGDSTTIDLTLTTAILHGQTVTVDYTAGTVTPLTQESSQASQATL